jgi:hypothetical protein
VVCKNAKVESKTTGPTETIPETFRKYLRNIPGKHITEPLKKAIMGTAHALRKVHTYKTFIMGKQH